MSRLVFAARRWGRHCTTTAVSAVRLLSKEETQRLAPSSALSLFVAIPDDVPERIRTLDIFVLRTGEGMVKAFENYCPHAGGPLNMIPDRYFTRDGRHLMCTRHGALFTPDDGACVRGPCAGSHLCELPIEVDEQGVRATFHALRRLCDEGGGAFVISDEDASDGSPKVSRPKPFVPTRRKRRGQSDRPTGDRDS